MADDKYPDATFWWARFSWHGNEWHGKLFVIMRDAGHWWCPGVDGPIDRAFDKNDIICRADPPESARSAMT